jgi:hypothetical protein
MDYSHDYNSLNYEIETLRDHLADNLKWYRKALVNWYSKGCKDLREHHALWEEYQRLKDIAKEKKYDQYFYEYVWAPEKLA